MKPEDFEQSIKIGRGVSASGIWVRLLFYLICYVPVTALLLFVIIMDQENLYVPFEGTIFAIFYMISLPFAPMALVLFFFFELPIQKNRKKLGLPLWRNIARDIEKLEIKKRLELEEEAKAEFEREHGK